ncbi:hypothetical protein OIV83_004609 [Microbotryomycetes sp. JL201]|nr:hypothetical protein OIV83_004609 [Microbotryomycetes sp. JL201]
MASRDSSALCDENAMSERVVRSDDSPINVVDISPPAVVGRRSPSRTHVIWTRFDDDCLVSLVSKIEQRKRDSLQRSHKRSQARDEENEDRPSSVDFENNPYIDQLGREQLQPTDLGIEAGLVDNDVRPNKRKRGGRQKDPMSMTMNDWCWVVEEMQRLGAHTRTLVAAKARYRSLVKPQGRTKGTVSSSAVEKKVRFSNEEQEEESEEQEVTRLNSSDREPALTNIDHKTWTPLQDRELERLKSDPPRRRRTTRLDREAKHSLSFLDLVKELETSPFAHTDDQDRQGDLSWSEISDRLSPKNVTFSRDVQDQVKSSPIKPPADCQLRWATLNQAQQLSSSSSSKTLTRFTGLYKGEFRSRESQRFDEKWRVRPSVRRAVKCIEQAYERSITLALYAGEMGPTKEGSNEHEQRDTSLVGVQGTAVALSTPKPLASAGGPSHHVRAVFLLPERTT